MVDFSKLQSKYEKLTAEKGQGNSDFLEKFLQLKDGTTIVRILPWRDDEQDFYAETVIHRLPPNVKNLDDNRGTNIHCLRHVGETCPVCELYFGLWKTKTDEDIKIARKIKGRERYYMNV